MRPLTLLALLCLSCLWLSVLAMPAWAGPCENKAGDSWYVTRLRVNTAALPFGVEMEGRLTPEHKPALVLTNKADILLRVAAHELGSGKSVVLTGAELEELMGVELVQVYGDNRPAHHQPPSGQRFMLVAYQGGNRVLLPGNVEYLLNPEYDPHASASAQGSCERRNNIYLILGIVILVGVVAIVIVRSLRGS